MITEFPFGIYVGNLGVSLFLIISGAALMHVYGDKLDLKSFYAKRLISIYPMFWMAYIVAVLPRLGMWRSMGLNIPKWRMLLTIAGMDGYLSEYGMGFYVLGEWFLGFIVLFYVIFPLLRFLIKRCEIVTWLLITITYILVLKYYNLDMSMSKCLLIRLPELAFGMSFVKHNMKVKWYMTIPAIAVLLCNQFLKPSLNDSIQTTYVGIAFFIILVFIADYVKVKGVKGVCGFLTKYSYAIFLVHHVIFEYIQAAFDVNTVGVLKSYAIFVVSAAVVLVVAWLLYSAAAPLTGKLNSVVSSRSKA